MCERNCAVDLATVAPGEHLITMPLAWMSCVAPAWSVPAHNVEPVVAVVADTQHGPVVVTVNR